MIVKNLTRKTIVTKDLKVAISIKDKSLGLLNPKNPRSLLIYTRFGIHTFFLKETIDVVIADKNLCVKSLKTLHPNSIFLYSPKYSAVIEIPSGTIKKSKTQIGDKLKVLK